MEVGKKRRKYCTAGFEKTYIFIEYNVVQNITPVILVAKHDSIWLSNKYVRKWREKDDRFSKESKRNPFETFCNSDEQPGCGCPVTVVLFLLPSEASFLCLL